MRIELERQDLRKKEANPVRQLELACIFTLCGMKTEHKFLAYKSAFTLNYKANNFITASHFARQVIDLESSGVSSRFEIQSTGGASERILPVKLLPRLCAEYLLTEFVFVLCLRGIRS